MMMTTSSNIKCVAAACGLMWLLATAISGSTAFTSIPTHALSLEKTLTRSIITSSQSSSPTASSLGASFEFDSDPYGGVEGPEDELYTELDGEEEELSDEELLAMAGEWDEKIAPFNTIHLSGRIGNDPEPRYFEDGKVVVNLSLAVRRKYHSLERMALKIASGEEETDWFGLEIWGQTAEFVSKYVDKGCRVGVVGTLEIDQWNDKNTGELRTRPKVVVRDFDILETRAESEMRRGGRSNNNYNSNNYNNNNRGGGDDFFDGGSSAGTGGFFDN